MHLQDQLCLGSCCFLFHYVFLRFFLAKVLFVFSFYLKQPCHSKRNSARCCAWNGRAAKVNIYNKKRQIKFIYYIFFMRILPFRLVLLSLPLVGGVK